MKCIFIGGADRSGTTMLASLLSKIDQSVVTPESLFKNEVLVEQPFCTKIYCDLLENNERFKSWALDITSLKKVGHSSFEDFYSDLIDLYNERRGAQYWIDHSPNNLVYSKWLNDVFSECYFIHIVRDGRAVAQSQVPLEWGSNTYLDASRAWNNKILYGFITQTLFPNKTLLVKYEDLLHNEENEISRIVSFLNNPKIIDLNGIKNDFLPEFTKSQHALVGKAPDAIRASAWKGKMTKQNIADFQYYAKDTLNLLDYKLIEIDGFKVTKLHLIKEYLKEIWFKKFVNPKKYTDKRKNDIKK